MLSTLGLLRILLDFGMLVLIWLVQLVIYPSFRYYTPMDLHRWHKKYMSNSPIVIIPLMLGQLVITCIQLYQDQNSYTIISLALILILWAHTFYRFVPLHDAIKNTEKPNKITLKLVNLNWWRTFLWSLLFVYTFITLAVFG